MQYARTERVYKTRMKRVNEYNQSIRRCRPMCAHNIDDNKRPSFAIKLPNQPNNNFSKIKHTRICTRLNIHLTRKVPVSHTFYDIKNSLLSCQFIFPFNIFYVSFMRIKTVFVCASFISFSINFNKFILISKSDEQQLVMSNKIKIKPVI